MPGRNYVRVKLVDINGEGFGAGSISYIGLAIKLQESLEERGKNGKKDSRDRNDAEIVDTYDPNKAGQGTYKEQKMIDIFGGKEKLDNKINATSQKKMEKLENTYDNGGAQQ